MSRGGEPVVVKAPVPLVMTCAQCRSEVLEADRLGDEEECALRDHLLGVHPNTVQPETLGTLLRHFVATEGPPPAAEVVSGQRGRARSETLRWRLDPGPRTGTSADVGHRMKKDDPPALDEGTLCWCCGAPSPCRCDAAGKRNECGWCRDHCRCFMRRDGETSDALWPIKVVSPLAEGRRSRERPARVSLPCPSGLPPSRWPGVSLSSDPYVVQNALTPNTR